MEEGRDLVSVMEDATRAFKLHMGTMKAWDFKFVPHGFVREHRHKGNSILDNEADIIPDIEDAEADQEDVKDDLDAEGDDAGSGAEDEKMEEGMKTLLFETLGPPLDEKIKQLFAISPASPPLGLATTAYPHQLYAAARLAHLARSTYCGGILADDMGFGKTRSSVLATIAAKRANGEGVVLIVTKKSLITTWKDEIINMFTDEKKPKIIIPTAQVSTLRARRPGLCANIRRHPHRNFINMIMPLRITSTLWRNTRALTGLSDHSAYGLRPP